MLTCLDQFRAMNQSLVGLKKSIEQLNNASQAELCDRHWLMNLVRSTGLTWDTVRNEGNECWQIDNDPGLGLNQTPEQFVPTLLVLRTLEIKKVIDIGTWCGWTACFLAAYLRRFQPELRLITIDKEERWSAAVKADADLAQLPIEYRVFNTQLGVPDDMSVDSDFCIIDAGHSYEESKNDWERFGTHARIVMFHDINDQPLIDRYRLRNQGTCVQLWNELRTDASIAHADKLEFINHPSRRRLMGIGLIIKSHTAQ